MAFNGQVLDKETCLAYYKYRYYHSLLGTFACRDNSVGFALDALFLSSSPVQAIYRDGPNLYQYVRGNSTNKVDPLGLWGEDIHRDLTVEMAVLAGIACPDEVGKGANAPDSGWRRPGAIGVVDIVLLSSIPFVGPSLAAKKTQVMAEWHFPAGADGIVWPDSTVAKAKVKSGIENCDFKTFSEGLHVLQDSWAHQGKPYIAGIGHGRGAKVVLEGYWDGWTFRQTGAHWKRTDGTIDAATSGSADDVTLWPEAARATGMATFKALVDFKNACPCHCPGPNGTRVKTSSGDAMTEREVDKRLNKIYPGTSPTRW
jgi:RHS repeat-associated protein